MLEQRFDYLLFNPGEKKVRFYARYYTPKMRVRNIYIYLPIQQTQTHEQA